MRNLHVLCIFIKGLQYSSCLHVWNFNNFWQHWWIVEWYYHICLVLQKYVLKLESTLSRTSYEYELPEITFTANISYRHFTFRFTPKVSHYHRNNFIANISYRVSHSDWCFWNSLLSSLLVRNISAIWIQLKDKILFVMCAYIRPKLWYF